MRVDDVAGNGPGIYCSPRHRMPFNSRNEGSKRVLATWLRPGNLCCGPTPQQQHARVRDGETRQQVARPEAQAEGLADAAPPRHRHA